MQINQAINSQSARLEQIPSPNRVAKPPASQDLFQKDSAASNPPKMSKKIWATASVTGSLGMLVGTRWGSSLGNPALGFALGTLIGGTLGVGLATFAYSAKDGAS